MVTAQQTQVKKYVDVLCEALEIDNRLYTTKSFRRSVLSGDDNTGYYQKQLDDIRNGCFDFNHKFYTEETRKYIKVIMETHGNRSVHCFVDKETGDVYKPASWKAPAKGVRFNLLDDYSREQCYYKADWAGSYLYRR